MANYRKIYAKHYGIVISPEYAVHHIDGNRENNDIKIFFSFRSSCTANIIFTKTSLTAGTRIRVSENFIQAHTLLKQSKSFQKRARNVFITAKLKIFWTWAHLLKA